MEGTNNLESPRTHRLWRWLAIMAVLGAAIGIAFAVTGGSATAVLSIGDSLTYQSAPVLIQDMRAQGDSPDIHAVPGSGLLDTKVNWQERARQYISQENPKIVVVEFVGDYGLFGEPPGVPPHSTAFYQQWAARAQELEYILASRGARVYWVIGPPMRNAVEEDQVVRIDDIYAHLHVPGSSTATAPLINTTAEFGTSDGGYTPTLPGPDGQPVQVRLPDGIHFTPAGVSLFAKILSNAVA
jgi:uncharacterized protein